LREEMKCFMTKLAAVAGFVTLLGFIGSVRAQAGDRCTLLTPAEAAVALGAPVQPGEAAISGCQWGQIGGNGFVQLQVAGARYYQRPPKTAKMISGIGQEAYTYSDMGSPHAMAKTTKTVVVVWASGDGANPEKVVDLLRMVVERLERE
jgi:hypothetical protein